MSQDTCYFLFAGSIVSSGYQNIQYDPCGTSTAGTYNASSGVQSCCVSGDICGANSICKWGTTHSHPQGGSGYYSNGCTDPLYQDPLCFVPCMNDESFVGDVKFHASPGIWTCCNRTSTDPLLPNCDEPLDELSFNIGWTADEFPGPIDVPLSTAITGAFDALTASLTDSSATSTTSSISLPTTSHHITSPQTASSATMGLATTSTSATSTPSSSSTSISEQSGLSTGAKAGIGVGAALVGLLLVGLAFAVFILWKRQSGRKGPARSENGAYSGATKEEQDQAAVYLGAGEDKPKYAEDNSEYRGPNDQLRSELPDNRKSRFEMSGHREYSELEGSYLR